MADVNIITPISQPQGASGVVQTPQENAESVLLSGTISGRDASGNYLLKTQNGTVALQSNVPLTYNSDVVLRLNTNAAQGTSARIVTVNGEAFSDFAQQAPAETDTISAFLNQTQQTTANTATSDSPQQLNLDSIQAVVVSSPSDASADASPQPQSQGVNAPPALPSGTNVVIQLPTEIAPPAQPAAQQGGATPQQPTPAVQQNTQQTAAQAVTSTADNTTEATSPQLPAQPVLNVNNPAEFSAARTAQPAHAAPTAAQVQGAITEEAVEETEQTAPSPLYAAYSRQITLSDTPQQPATPPAAMPAAASAAPATPTVVQGQVTSVAKDGTITVQTEAGTVTLKADSVPAARLTPGTNITIEVLETATAASTAAQSVASAASAPTLSSIPASLAEIAGAWESFTAIVSMLENTGNAATNQSTNTPSLPSGIPQLGSNFVSSSLSFLSSLASGNTAKALGNDTVDNLKAAGQTGLLQRFISEASMMFSATAAKTEQPVPTWQATFLPFVYQGEAQQARIYVKRDGSQNKKQGTGKVTAGGTRFVVEVDLSEMGGVQMDGLIRKKQANTVFDLMIRSNTEFTPQERNDITDIYNEAAQQTGFSGSIAFQTTHDFPVKPLDEILANQNKVVVA